MPVVVLTGTVEKEGNQYVSYCLELGAASCGDTVEEALDMLEESIEVYLEELVDLGYLDKVFQEKGITVQDDSPGNGVNVQVCLKPGRIYRAYAMNIPALAVA